MTRPRSLPVKKFYHDTRFQARSRPAKITRQSLAQAARFHTYLWLLIFLVMCLLAGFFLPNSIAFFQTWAPYGSYWSGLAFSLLIIIVARLVTDIYNWYRFIGARSQWAVLVGFSLFFLLWLTINLVFAYWPF